VATTNDIANALALSKRLSTQAGAYAAKAQQYAVQAQTLANQAIRLQTSWKGTWNSGTQYQTNDMVADGGASYIALNPSINIEPPSPSHWGVVAEAGSGAVHSSGGLEGDGSIGDPVVISTGGVSYSSIQNVSATDKVLGRSTAGAGAIEEIPMTAAGRALAAGANAAAQRTSLGLSSIAASGSASDLASGTLNIARIADASIPHTKFSDFPFLGYALQYTSPTGNNANNGTKEFPKKTASAAYAALSSFGGTIKVTTGVKWSDGTEGLGLTDNQGMRINGWWAQIGHSQAGWLGAKNFKLAGYGLDVADGFGSSTVRLSWGVNDGNRVDPSFWAVGLNGGYTLENVSFESHLPARIGWDYRRNDSNGSIALANITHAARTTASRSVTHVAGDGVVLGTGIWTFEDGAFTDADVNGVIVVAGAANPGNDGTFSIAQVLSSTTILTPNVGLATESFGSGVTCTVRQIPKTVFTVDYPAAWQLISLQRTGDVTTAIVNNTNRVSEYPQIHNGTFLHLVTSAVGFTTGDYVATNFGLIGDDTTWAFNFTDPGVDTGLVSATGSTLAGHAVLPRDIIEIQSTNDEWQSTMYFVTATTATTITVEDRTGQYGTRSLNVSADNIGQYVLQDRQLDKGVCLDYYDRCTFASLGIEGAENGQCGPSMDRGGTTAGGWSYINDGSFFGGQIDLLVDPNRTAAIFTSGGVSHAGGFQAVNCRTGAGNVRFDGNVSGGLALEFVNSDSSHRPLLELLPGQSGAHDLRVKSCSVADVTLVPAVDLGGVAVFGTIKNTKGIINASGFQKPLVLGEIGQWSSEPNTFEATNKLGWYGQDGTLAGKRSDVQSQFGTVAGLGLENCLPQDLTLWTSTGVTVTAGAKAPNGTNNAFRLTGTGTLAVGQQVAYKDFTSDVGPVSAGDAYVFGAWIKGVNGSQLLPPGGNLVSLSSYSLGVPLNPGAPPPIAGDGQWQWVTSIGIAPVAANGEPSLTFYFNVGGAGMDVFQPTLIRLLKTEYTKNEAYRIHNIFQAQQNDIPKGDVTTLPGAKLIGTAGLGTGAYRTVGVSDGQITLGSATGEAIEFFGTDGHTRGVIALQAYTINGTLTAPPKTGLQLWLDAAVGVTMVSTKVSKWADQSGNGFDVHQDTDANRPTVTASSVNSLPGIHFPGVSTGISLDNFTDNIMRLGKARSVYAVVKAGEDSSYVIIDFRRSPFALALTAGFGANVINSDGAANISTTDGIPITNATPTLAEWYSAGSPGFAFSFFTNGTARALDASALTKPDNGATGFSVGSDFSATYTFKGDICEILVYDADLGPIEVAQVRAYLNNKYGL
jgi:hypothetical protein